MRYHLFYLPEEFSRTGWNHSKILLSVRERNMSLPLLMTRYHLKWQWRKLAKGDGRDCKCEKPKANLIVVNRVPTIKTVVYQRQRSWNRDWSSVPVSGPSDHDRTVFSHRNLFLPAGSRPANYSVGPTVESSATNVQYQLSWNEAFVPMKSGETVEAAVCKWAYYNTRQLFIINDFHFHKLWAHCNN